MTAPKRLIDDGSAFDRALLRAGREDRPSSAYERRVIAAASTLSASASAAAGHPSWLSRLVRPQYLAAVVAIGVGTAFVSSTSVRQGSSFEAASSAANATPNAKTQPEVSSAPSPAMSSETSAEASPHAAPVTTPEALPSAPAPVVTAARASVSAPAPVEPPARVVAAVSSSSGVSLQREVELLDSVKQSLRSGAHADAQRALDGYDAEFPSGTLKPEAGFLRIRLLLAKGDRAKARALGDELRTRYPKGVHARRIEAALAADAANEGQDQASPR